jgi:hypothetical protein
MTDEQREVMDECKSVIESTISRLVGEGVRIANIDIELTHFIRRELYKD